MKPSFKIMHFCCIYNYFSEPSTTRRHGNFSGVHTLLRILLSSNSAVLINIIIIIIRIEYVEYVYPTEPIKG
jgi:hypothetical protein